MTPQLDEILASAQFVLLVAATTGTLGTPILLLVALAGWLLSVFWKALLVLLHPFGPTPSSEDGMPSIPDRNVERRATIRARQGIAKPAAFDDRRRRRTAREPRRR
jgi:hypothetical protein